MLGRRNLGVGGRVLGRGVEVLGRGYVRGGLEYFGVGEALEPPRLIRRRCWYASSPVVVSRRLFGGFDSTVFWRLKLHSFWQFRLRVGCIQMLFF